MDPTAAHIVVTVLVLVAFGLSLGAGISGLSKWRDYRERVASYDSERKRGAAFMDRQRDEHRVFIESHPVDEWDASRLKQANEAREAGFAPKTYAEVDLDNFVGERPPDKYQAPGEVWVGLAALIVATVASIIDVWAG